MANDPMAMQAALQEHMEAMQRKMKNKSTT